MKVIVYVSTNKVGSLDEKIVEIDDSEIEGMTKQEINEYIEEFAQEQMFELIEWGWVIKGE